MAGLLLGELCIHGRDVARAAKLSWSISPSDASILFTTLAALAPTLVTDVGRTRGTVKLRLRGQCDLYLIAEPSGLRVEPDTGLKRRAGLHISAQPVALLLVAYGRAPIWRAVGSGRLRGWGRPGLALRFSNLIAPP